MVLIDGKFFATLIGTSNQLRINLQLIGLSVRVSRAKNSNSEISNCSLNLRNVLDKKFQWSELKWRNWKTEEISKIRCTSLSNRRVLEVKIRLYPACGGACTLPSQCAENFLWSINNFKHIPDRRRGSASDRNGLFEVLPVIITHKKFPERVFLLYSLNSFKICILVKFSWSSIWSKEELFECSKPKGILRR